MDLELRRADGALELVVADDGEAVVDPVRFVPGRGLRIMAYRARSIGASLAIELDPRGHGVRIRCTLPAV